MSKWEVAVQYTFTVDAENWEDAEAVIEALSLNSVLHPQTNERVFPYTTSWELPDDWEE